MINLFNLLMLMIMGILQKAVIFQYGFQEVIRFEIKKLSILMKIFSRQ